MNARNAVLLAVVAVALVGCDEARDTHVREDRLASLLPLAPQTSIRIETRTADVHVVPSPDDTVRVLTVKRVQSMSQRSVDNLWNQIKVTSERSGDELVLRVREPENGTSHVTVEAGPWRLRRRVEVEITVAVPLGRPVSILTERGDIDAHDLKQSLTVDLYNGDAHLYDLDGGTLKVSSTAGDITVQRVRQAVQLRSTSGDIDAEDVTGPVALRATSGDITLDRAQGRVAIETSTGGVDADGIVGNVTISTSSGDANLKAQGDSILVDTSSGDQTIDLLGAPRFVSLKSAAGTVELQLPKGVGGALDVQTATGAISVASAIDVGTMTRNHLTGKLGGGGETLIRSSSGDIHLTAVDATVAVQGEKP
jgi:DUF4097 and DUF4098 domain-containing protein YvlB